MCKQSEKRPYQKLPQQPLTLAGEEQRPWRPVMHLLMESNQVDLSGKNIVFKWIFQVSFTFLCDLEELYVNVLLFFQNI